MIELRALGTAEIHTEAATLTPSQGIVFAAALYLILERGKPVSRVQLAGLLWPDTDDQSRAHRLRQTILQLKKLGCVVSADRIRVWLSNDQAKCDFDGISRDDLSIGPRTSVEFLPGYSPRCSEALRDWLDTKRRERHAELTRLLNTELEHRRRKGDWQRIEEIAAKCLSLDPFNEVAVLAQAESAAMRGAKRAAIALLDRYIADVGSRESELKIPAAVLRRRVVERIPETSKLANPDPDFVGREIELEALTRAFERARTGKGSALAIIGEPGIGKSRLAAEVARFAQLQGSHVQRAKCRLADLDRPLSLFVDMVPQLREMPGALGCAPGTFSSLKRLTEFEQRAGDSTLPSDSLTLFENVREALFDLLDSVAEERCLVLVIDDVHWLDTASAKILIQIVEWCETKRVLLLVSSRPTNSLLLDYAEKAHVQTIKLDALPSAASSVLLKSVAMGLGDVVQAEFVEWCLAVAEGNPFFLQELAHHWIETGHRYEAPPSVSSVLQERLSRISSGALQVLQTCAILGDSATINRVERVLEYPPHQLLSAVQELSNAAMLGTQTVESDTGRLQPRHDFLSTAAVSRLTPTSLAYLHRRCADVLNDEISQTAMPATLLWACANHAHRAGDKKRALALALSCAHHLLDVGLAEPACKRYEDSLTYCLSDEDRVSVLGPLAIAYQIDGRWDRSKDTLRSCIKLSSGRDDSEPHNEFEIQLLYARFRSDLDFVALLDASLPCVQSRTASPQHRVSAAVVALKVASDVGPASMLDTIYDEVAPLLDLDQVDQVSRLECEIIYRTMRTTEDISVSLLDKFANTARSLHGEMAYAQALLGASSACRIAAKDEDALRFAALAFEHAIKHKLRARIPVIRLAEIRLHSAAENWEAARTALSGLVDYPICDEDRNTRAEWDFYDARIALQEGDLVRAERAMEQFGNVPPFFSANRRAACLAIILRLQLARGDPIESVRPIVRDLEATHLINRDIGNQDYEAVALFLGRLALGEAETAYDQLRAYAYRYRTTRRAFSRELQELLTRKDKPVSGSVGGNLSEETSSAFQETAARRTDPLSGVV